MVETKACKLIVFQDETSIPWQSMMQAPIRAVMSQVSELNLCRNPACKHDCACFHPSVEETVESVILDVWSRQYQKLEGGRAEPASAAVFCAFLRIPASALMVLQKTSYPGVYFEPRGQSGADFALIWLPGQDGPTARHTFQTCARAVALTRLGRKFGVRVRAADEQATFETLRPGLPFNKVAITAKYRLHPLPVGCQRSSVIQLLRKWNWKARPLQPGRGDAEGAAWEVALRLNLLPRFSRLEMVLCLSRSSRKCPLSRNCQLCVRRARRASTSCRMIKSQAMLTPVILGCMARILGRRLVWHPAPPQRPRLPQRPAKLNRWPRNSGRTSRSSPAATGGAAPKRFYARREEAATA